jgi:hypothetical protein
MKPLNDFVLVRKCVNDHVRKEDGSVLLYRTDWDHEQTNWAEIIDVGPKCTDAMKGLVGYLVQCPESIDGLHNVGEDLFVVREHLLNRKELAGIAILHEDAHA